MPRLIALAAVVAAGLLSTAADASARTIGKASASGDYAIALASGHASHPRRIYVKVTSSPRQTVLVSWTVVCSKGTGAGSRSGQFSKRTTLRRRLKLPYSRPHDCTVSAAGQLNGGGHVKVVLQAYR